MIRHVIFLLPVCWVLLLPWKLPAMVISRIKEITKRNIESTCPISSDRSIPDTISVVGEFPVWITNVWQNNTGSSSSLNNLSSPAYEEIYPRFVKVLVYVDNNTTGTLFLSGRKLNSDAPLGFAKREETLIFEGNNIVGRNVSYDRNELIYSLTIPHAALASQSPNPEGYSHHGVLMHFPESGCYKIMAELGNYSAEIFLDVR